jgi:hypothetical protein
VVILSCNGALATATRQGAINSAFNRDDRDGAAIEMIERVHGRVDPTGRFRIIGGQLELWCAARTMIFLLDLQEFQLDRSS